jgi:uncharacterized protein (TIGR03546 family)
MLVLKFLLNFIQTLNQDVSPRSLAGGLALGMVVGFVPKIGLLALILLILIFMLNVNFGAATFSAAAFTLIAWIVDPVFNKIGYALLTAPSLRALWTLVYNTPAAPWTRFNNTLVLGGFVTGLVSLVPAFFLFRWGVVKYRERVLARVQKWKVVQALKASRIFGLIHDTF